MGENAKDYTLKYGNIARQSLGAITRAIVALEAEGGELFFGEPALNIGDWLCTDCNGKGTIQILDCQKLIQNPSMYGAFLLWMLSELFEVLPEAGDREKPKLVFFFDEAHLLFDHASRTLLEKIEKVVKLIRSKGVGIYFITQNPSDIPDGVLGQLGNKIQHALHAYTPAEQKGAKAAAQSFRENPEFDTYDTLLELGIGEALVSVLDENGVPTVVKRCRILPPQSQMGALEEEVRESQIRNCLLYTKYMEMTDRDSAYEFLVRRAAGLEEEAKREAEEKQRQKEEAAAEKQRQKEEAAAEKQRQKEEAAAEKQRQRELERQQKALEREKEKKEKAVRSEMNKIAGSAAGTIGRELGNQVGKTVGGSFGKRLGGNLGASLGRGILNTLLKK